MRAQNRWRPSLSPTGHLQSFGPGSTNSRGVGGNGRRTQRLAVAYRLIDGLELARLRRPRLKVRTASLTGAINVPDGGAATHSGRPLDLAQRRAADPQLGQILKATLYSMADAYVSVPADPSLALANSGMRRSL
jgi:hypothetical protein